MQVIMQKATRSVYGNLRPGQELDVDDNTGLRWIKHGIAEAAHKDQAGEKGHPGPAGNHKKVK